MTRAHPARVPEYLQHIVEAIDRATGYVAGMDEKAFEQDTRTQDAVIRSLQIIGEAANKARVANPELQATASDIPWDVMYGMRNRIIHDYFGVDLDVVWQTTSGICQCCVRKSWRCWRGFRDELRTRRCTSAPSSPRPVASGKSGGKYGDSGGPEGIRTRGKSITY